MKRGSVLLLIVAACLACSPAAIANEHGAMSDLQDVLKKGMAYADLRTAVLAQGWKPVPTAECKRNVGGDANICAQLPELESCSGDGYCISHYESPTGERLDVIAYGMPEDWSVAGADSRLVVVEWSRLAGEH